MCASTATLQILLLTLVVSTESGVLTLTPDRGTTISISSGQVKGCKVCSVAGRARQCNSSLLLKDNTAVSVEFECPKPQDAFSVEIVRNIECTTKSCNGHIIQADAGSLPLLAFNRTFTWNLKASAPKAFKIDFSSVGLRQIDPSERCPDRHSFSLKALQTTGNATVGKYCRTGPIRSAQILDQGSFSLDVPAGQKLQNGQFDVSVGEEIKSLAKITLMLPKGTSLSELLSPNYPDSFPDDDVMEWYFQVPDKHKTAVQFSKLTQPRCVKKQTAVEYHSKGRGALVLSLMDPQPHQTQGNFSLMLRNCEMDRRRAGSPGLSLNLKVSSSSKSSAVLCKVDMSKMEGLSLHIEKMRAASDCEMKMNSVPKEKITVTSNSDLSFQDCHPEDVQVTAMRVIECSQLKYCPKAIRLSMPLLPTCMPAPLNHVTWTLRPPEDGTVELTSPTMTLKQSLPGQPCNDSIIIKATEDDGTTIGHFCPQGSIQMVQIHTNVSVTVSGMAGKTPRMAFRHVLNARLKGEISERYIFTVSPKKDTPVLLASPGWPVGMKSLSTVSWIVSVPPKMEAVLMFANLSQPKCSDRHTNIRVQRVGCPEEEYSRREDEMAKSEITVSESFYLNMSNCNPERGDFSVVTKITLQKSKSLLLTIILSVVAALLVIFVIVLVVVCVVIRKKKKKLNHQVSIYNPNGTIFLPGQNGLPKTVEDDDCHEYASIEDTLVYTHLLRKGREIGVYGEFDTYQPFSGHTDSQKPLVSKDNGPNDVPVGTYQEFRFSSQQAPPLPVRPASHNQSLVDNVIYQAEDQSEEERSPSLGPRLEPEGGN
ncbi:CUB domain-containing protein 1a [Pempheris klunzingeri]|uniref:CUB domain-containing protein 1a n=1 Tax=Pempheris klunzingeri TaxID=3127111 RepID=UPI00397F872D